MSEITLKYWNGRGLMEVPRMLLAIGGKFPGDYTDGRYSAPADNLEANLGRMPICQVGNECIGQSAAINYYLASENGLMGSSNLEAAKILGISEHLKEMGTAFRNLVPYGSEPTEEALNKWFSEGATDVSGPAAREGYSTRFLTWWMGRIEATLDNSGFAVGGKLSLADVLLYNHFGEFLRDEEAGELAKHRREPFCCKKRMDAMLAKHPKIKGCVDSVANHPNIQKWLNMRGVQGF